METLKPRFKGVKGLDGDFGDFTPTVIADTTECWCCEVDWLGARPAPAVAPGVGGVLPSLLAAIDKLEVWAISTGQSQAAGALLNELHDAYEAIDTISPSTGGEQWWKASGPQRRIERLYKLQAKQCPPCQVDPRGRCNGHMTVAYWKEKCV